MRTTDIENFAPFDLKKSRKYNRNTDQLALCKSFYELASAYYDVARHTFPCFEWMPVTLSNAAFSCELFLKSLLYGFGIDFKNTHGLKNLFEFLPQSEQSYIEENIAIENREREFQLCLREQSDAFVEYRYMCEAKAITGNPLFLLAFADILKFVYESLVKENAQQHEPEMST
jgi:HEPN domain-containing protein